MVRLEPTYNPDSNDEEYMREALRLAREAEQAGEVPVGAVVVLDDKIIGRGSNAPIALHDPTAHAEIQAMRAAAQKIGNYRLVDASLYVTLEPCPMCAGAMVHARIQNLIYASKDPRSGAAGTVFSIADSDELNHRVNVKSGLLAAESTALLQAFFKSRR